MEINDSQITASEQANEQSNTPFGRSFNTAPANKEFIKSRQDNVQNFKQQQIKD